MSRLDLMHKCCLLVPVMAACALRPAASSQEAMGAERSRVMVMRPIKDATLDITRRFTERGFTLAEYDLDDRGITLRFRGHRKTLTETRVNDQCAAAAVSDALTHGYGESHRHRCTEVVTTALGSVFHVRVEPRGKTATSIVAVGRPVMDGVEACTPDPEIRGSCGRRILAGEALYPELAGIAEAEIIEGVFSELWLTGDVISPDPATLRARYEAQLAERRCQERRRELRALASRVSEPRARAQILGAAPICQADERVEAAAGTTK
jgi:hypothetical protein